MPSGIYAKEDLFVCVTKPARHHGRHETPTDHRPGWKNSGPEHWQSRWADALPHAIRVQQRDWEQPSCAEWTAAVAAEVDKARSPVLLIAHSLGCLACAALPVPLRARWRAPCWWRRQTWNAPTPRTVCAASRRSPDLAALPERGGGQRQRSLLPPGARAPVRGTLGQPPGGRARRRPINADSGLGDWPQGLKLLGALRRRSSWQVSPPPERISPVPVRPCRTRAETRHTAFADTRLLPGRSCPSWGHKKPRDARVRGGVDRPRYRGSRRITAADCAASRHSSRARPDAASADRPWVDHWRRRPSRRRRARSWRPTRWR